MRSSLVTAMCFAGLTMMPMMVKVAVAVVEMMLVVVVVMIVVAVMLVPLSILYNVRVWRGKYNLRRPSRCNAL